MYRKAKLIMGITVTLVLSCRDFHHRGNRGRGSQAGIEWSTDFLQIYQVLTGICEQEWGVELGCRPQKYTSVLRSDLIIVLCKGNLSGRGVHASTDKLTVQSSAQVKPGLCNVGDNRVDFPSDGLGCVRPLNGILAKPRTSIIYSGRLTVHTIRCLPAILHSDRNLNHSAISGV